jgi:acyl dehydratase
MPIWLLAGFCAPQEIKQHLHVSYAGSERSRARPLSPLLWSRRAFGRRDSLPQRPVDAALLITLKTDVRINYLLNEGSMEALAERVGEVIGTSPWLAVTQDMITSFGQSTLDPDPMHIDPDWAALHSPYGTTIAFGFQTMSLLTYLMHATMKSLTSSHGEMSGHPLNYGFDRLRLVSPVKVDSEIRATFRLMDMEARSPQQTLSRYEVIVEIRGEEKPAMVAEWLVMWVNDGTEPHLPQ